MKEKDGWTFGIITDGHHSNRILKIIKSIETQAIKYYAGSSVLFSDRFLV